MIRLRTSVVDLTRSSSNLYERLRITVGDNRRGHPITIVFADATYSEILDNWLRHAKEYVAESLIVFSLDATTHARMTEQGMTSLLLPFSGAIDELWLLRLSIFEALVVMDVSFIHSDVDAIWLDDPRQFCFDLGADLAISSGTIWPPEAVDLWGFVLCCGFFCVRARPEMVRFFADVRQAALNDRDDQKALNRVLIKAGTTWDSEAIPYDVENMMGRQFRNFESVVFGKTAKFDLKLCVIAPKPLSKGRQSLRQAVGEAPIDSQRPSRKDLGTSCIWLLAERLVQASNGARRAFETSSGALVLLRGWYHVNFKL